MRKKLWLGLGFFAALLLIGCGGSGGGGTDDGGGGITGTFSRTLVGFVYVKKEGSPVAGPEVIITPAQTPPNAEYDVPTTGMIALLADEAKFRKVSKTSFDGQNFTRNLNEGNDILITATTEGSGRIGISGTNISIGGSARKINAFDVDIRSGGSNNTTFNINSPDSIETRQPQSGAVSEVKFSLDGRKPTELSGELVAGQKAYLAVAFMDANGISLPNLPATGTAFQTTSSDPAKISIDPVTKLMIPALGGQSAGDVTITGRITSPAASGTLRLGYNFGEPKTVEIFRKNTTGAFVKMTDPTILPFELRWAVESNPQPTAFPSSVELYAAVTNEFGGNIPGQTIVWTNPAKAPDNVWATTVGGPCFVDPVTDEPMNETVTDSQGYAKVKVVTPPAVDGDLGGTPAAPTGAGGSGDSFPKFQNYIFATAKGTPVRNDAPAKIYIGRDLQFLRIREKTTTLKRYVDTNQREQYNVYGVDVDQDEAENPPSVKWTVFNQPGGHKVGNPGERELQKNVAPTSQAAMEPGGILITGPIAGEVTITVQSTDTLSGLDPDSYQISIYGPPTQVFFVQGPAVPDPDAPWEASRIPVSIASNPFTTPASELRFSQGQWNGDPTDTTPDDWVAYLYAGICDSWGHNLTGLAGVGYEMTVAKGEPYHPFSVEVTGDPSGVGGEPCAIVTFLANQGPPGEAIFTLTGTYSGVRGTLSEEVNLTRTVRINFTN